MCSLNCFNSKIVYLGRLSDIFFGFQALCSSFSMSSTSRRSASDPYHQGRPAISCVAVRYRRQSCCRAASSLKAASIMAPILFCMSQRRSANCCNGNCWYTARFEWNSRAFIVLSRGTNPVMRSLCSCSLALLPRQPFCGAIIGDADRCCLLFVYQCCCCWLVLLLFVVGCLLFVVGCWL